MNKIITLKDGRDATIRNAVEIDAKQIIKKMEWMIRNENYLEEDENSLNDVEQEKKEIKKIKREGSLYAVIDIKGDIAGVLILKRGKLHMNKHTVNVRIWIGENYRGQGLASKLMEYGIDWCQKNNIEKVCLDVFNNNRQALRLYEKFGFVVEGTRRNQFLLDNEYIDEIFMSKFLLH